MKCSEHILYVKINTPQNRFENGTKDEEAEIYKKYKDDHSCCMDTFKDKSREGGASQPFEICSFKEKVPILLDKLEKLDGKIEDLLLLHKDRFFEQGLNFRVDKKEIESNDLARYQNDDNTTNTRWRERNSKKRSEREKTRKEIKKAQGYGDFKIVN
jgi:hypothetical protein